MFKPLVTAYFGAGSRISKLRIVSKRRNVSENGLHEFDGYLCEKANPVQPMVFTLWIDINPPYSPLQM